MGNGWENSGNSDRLIWGTPKSLQMVMAGKKLKEVFNLQNSEKRNVAPRAFYEVRRTSIRKT